MDEPNLTTSPAASPPAQATPPTPAPAPAPGDMSVSAPPTEYVLQPSGDPATDLAFKFLATNGVVPGSAAWEAAQKGDFAVVKATLAEKGVKGAAEYVAILEDRAAKAVEGGKAKAAAVQTAVHAAVGGQESWTQIKNWVADNADDHELEAVNAALKGSPFLAKIMAEGLKARFERSTGVAPQTASAQMPGLRASGAPAPLTAAGYQEAVTKLRQTLGNRMDGSPEFAALRQRRMDGLARGA